MESRQPLLPEIFTLHAKWRPNKAAVIHPSGVATWRDFVLATNKVANGLRAIGLAAGDRVGIVMSNEMVAVEVIFGVMRAGMVAVPINLSVSDAAITAMLNDAEVVGLFATGDQMMRTDGVRHAIPSLKSGQLFAASSPGTPLPRGWNSYSAWLAQQSCADPAIVIEANNIANIIYSSGTTGVPKGIAHTHLGRLNWAYDLAVALRYHDTARTLLTLGLYSNISWVMMLCTFLAGGTLLLQRKFDAAAAVRAIVEQGATHTAMVPIQYRRLLNQLRIGESDLSRMQSLMSCGSALPPDLKAQLFDAFPCGVIELYGLTEGVITTLEPEDARGRLSSVGKPIQGTDIRLLDEAGHVVPQGQLGEIAGLCRFTMQGYWNKPTETVEATWQDESGRVWLRTGDIGRLDEDGFLYIVDRKKDMILSGGQNIYPADIEAVLLTHSDVLDCAVIGVPHAEWGETPLAVVVLRPSQTTSEDLRAWVNAKVGRRQRVSAVVFVDELPRNPNGKILKRELRRTIRA